MTEEFYRDLDYCICRYNCYFGARKRHISRGDVLKAALKPLLDHDGRINMNKFINLIQQPK